MPKDHISLPKTTLLKFSNSGVFKYLELKRNKIFSGKAATYNTEESYYSSRIEKLLSDEIEKKIGRLSSDIEKCRNDNKEFTWHPDELKKICYSWIIVQWIRTVNAKEGFRKASVFKDVLPPQIYTLFMNENIDKFLSYGERVFEKLPAQGMDLEVSLCMLPKNCASTFLLPTTHFMGVNSGLFFILSPHSCVFYAPKERIPSDQIVTLSDEAVDSLIEHFVRHETNHGDGHLIGYEEQLIKAQKYIKENF